MGCVMAWGGSGGTGVEGLPLRLRREEVDYMVVFAVADKMRMWEAGARRAVSGTGGFRRVMRAIPLGFSAEGMETNVEGGAHTEDHN